MKKNFRIGPSAHSAKSAADAATLAGEGDEEIAVTGARGAPRRVDGLAPLFPMT
jgi:hypothetical protein